MRAPEHATVIELEVPFHHTDGLQVVWHGNYLGYFAAARTQLFRDRHLDVQDMLDLGYGLLISEVRCKYAFPLRYGERFRVAAWLGEVDRRVRVRYEIWNLTHDRRSARGYTDIVATDANGMLCLEIPDAIQARLQD
ncbi:MAG: thioesterase family protein [Myxococcota bacterium]|nr:thioesterase family protein [Myxococcota bacterium]